MPAETDTTLEPDQNVWRVKTEVFEGPLDLLLTLIQRRKLFINDVSLSKITDDYLAFVEEAEDLPVEDCTHFVVVASTLVLIKSRSLLPQLDLTEEEEGSIEELQERLEQYQKIKQLSQHIKAAYGRSPMMSGRPRIRRQASFDPTEEVNLAELTNRMGELLLRLPKPEQIPQREVRRVISLKESIESLSRRLESELTASFSRLAGHRRDRRVSRMERRTIVVTFLAMLELVKRGLVQVYQRAHFDEIELSRDQNSQETAE